MSSQDQEPVASPNTQKRAPPPVPSRERRSTLGGPSDSTGSLPTLSNVSSVNVQEPSNDIETENNNSASIDDANNDQSEEGTSEFVEPEYVVEQIPPIELTNGEPLADQWVAPRHYRHYIVVVSGNNDDVVDFRISRTLRAGGTNIYVNAPRPDVSALKLLEPLKNVTVENANDEQSKNILESVLPLFPSKTSHDWNPTKGVFLGPVGEYLISVEGIANYIEKDDKYLISPDSNWTNFDLLSEWTILDSETRKKLDEISSKYKKDKVNSVWSSSYSQEVGSKYESLLADYQLELERRELEQQETTFDFRKIDLQELLQVDLTKANASMPLPVTTTRFPQKYQVSADSMDGTNYSVTKRVQSVSNPSDNFVAYVLDSRIAAESGIQINLLLNQISVLKNPMSHLAHIVDVFQSANGVLAFIYANLPTTTLLNGVTSINQYNEAHARAVICQLLDALHNLHSKNIIHAAVAAENVFIKNVDQITAVLHGVEFLRDIKETDTSFGYPLQYQAPELIGQEGLSFATDLWALGCIVYLLLVGKLPFDDNNRIKLSGKIRQGNYEIPSSVPTAVQSLIKGLLDVDASKRLKLADAKEHPWIKSSSSAPLSQVQLN